MLSGKIPANVSVIEQTSVTEGLVKYSALGKNGRNHTSNNKCFRVYMKMWKKNLGLNQKDVIEVYGG